MKNDNKKNCDENEVEELQLIDPDPLSVFFGILGAVGSLASIVGLAEIKFSQWEKEREREEKTRRELEDLFMALEVEYIELTGLLKGLEVILIQGVKNDTSLSDHLFEFGGMKPQFTFQGYRKFDETLLSINRKTGKLIEITSQILQRLYRYQVYVPHLLIDELVKFTADLNLLLRQPLNYEDAFRAYYDILNRSQFLSRELRKCLRQR